MPRQETIPKDADRDPDHSSSDEMLEIRDGALP